MKKASQHLIGTHNFSPFANQQHEGSAAKDPVRTIDRIDFVSEPGVMTLEFEGNGFLYKMVRNITGTLLEVGGRQRSSEGFAAKILQAKDRRAAGKAAEARGLGSLAKVIYSFEKSALNEG
jgi:tRNA pseudouridine38-40 synthase